MARQLALDLPLRAAFGREDFLVTGSNSEAVALVDQWPQWPTHAALLVGPAGSGKSHLATVWQQNSGAATKLMQDLVVEQVADDLGSGALVLENADTEKLPERALFHALNLAAQQGAHILITAKTPPQRWRVGLPDLASRLAALPFAVIRPPDDALLRGVLVKHFTDRQIAVDDALVQFLVLRMPRSLDAARRLVAEIDARALEEGAEVTRPFAARVLADFAAPQFFNQEE